jgi:hypothetical protein
VCLLARHRPGGLSSFQGDGMSAALADADLSDLDEALRHLSLVPTAERGPAWYAYSDALLEARANLEKP